MKNVVFIVVLLFFALEMQSQLTKAEYYIIKSESEMFGVAVHKGSIIFNESDKKTYILNHDAGATQSLYSTAAKILISTGPKIESSSSVSHEANHADITSFSVDIDGVTDISEAIKTAWNEADVIFFPGTKEGVVYKISEAIRIPIGKKLKFGTGAILHVSGRLVGTNTEIIADMDQIFSISSNLSGTWKNDFTYPEWFGAKADGFSDCTPAIQKTIDVFKRNIKLTGNIYKVYSSINIGSDNSIYLNSSTTIVPAAKSNVDLFIITGEPFVIAGGKIKIERGYNKWVFNVSIDRLGEGDYSPRFASVIRDIIVEGITYAQHDFSGMAYNGIKLTSAKKSDYSYFSLMDNVNFYRPDTAIYLSGHNESGMNNSWHWSNITIDWSMRGIILKSKAAGHVFTNLIIQPNTRKKTTIIEVASKYNSFQGMIWDIHSPNTIVLKKGAANNYFSHMGWVDIYENYVIDQSGYKALNVFATASPFEPTKNHYSYYVDERMMIGFKDNRSSNVPRFAVKSSNNRDAVTAAFIKKVWNFGGNTNLESAININHAIILSTQSDVNMLNGFGTGVTFTIKDPTTDSTHYNRNIMARVLARRDGNNEKGLLQFFTKGTNASSPSMTIRNSGNVGIGTTDPSTELEVEGSATISRVLTLTPQTSAPSNPKEGTIYINSEDGNIYCHLGGIWKQLNN